MKMRKKVSVLGCTGSIGKATLDVIRHLPQKFQVFALAVRSNIDLLEEQIKEFRPEFAVVFDPDSAIVLQKRLPNTPILSGLDGLKAAAGHKDVDFVMLAMSGSIGLHPALAAIHAKKQIGLANKEILVMAGEMISGLAKQQGVELLPVDSEHSALFQCLRNEPLSSVRRLILTASGGPFRKKNAEELEKVSLEEALCHPNWSMGPKITVDSSTLLNKGLEMIEARWLFEVEPERIDVIVHPQSVIHSLVEYVDGSILAQLSKPNMVLPIQYALTYPERKPGLLAPFDFQACSQLTFEPPDKKRFLCLQLALDALKAGGSYPCALNAAGEILVERFLSGCISWIDIGRKLEKLMSSHRRSNMLSLDSILSVDCEMRELARQA